MRITRWEHVVTGGAVRDKRGEIISPSLSLGEGIFSTRITMDYSLLIFYYQATSFEVCSERAQLAEIYSIAVHIYPQMM